MARLLFLVIPVTSSPTPHPPQPFRETPNAMAKHQRYPQSSHYSSDRTSNWVSHLHHGDAVDATMPPSDTESAIYSSDSDTGSSHSVPPHLLLRFPDGREQHVSAYSNQQNSRSRTTSNNYGPPLHHHHQRSSSTHPSTKAPGPLFRRNSSQPDFPDPENIRVLPPQRSMTPGTAEYINPRPHRSRTSSTGAPSPRRAYDRGSSDTSSYGPQDKWVQRYGQPEQIQYSHSHPRSKFDMPTRDYSAHRLHPSSKLSRHPVMGSPTSHMSQLTKENTIANSHSRTQSRGIIRDDRSVIDEDEEWEREQQRIAHRRGRGSPQSSNSPTLTYSRSRTTSSSSRSGHHPPGPQVPVSFRVLVQNGGRIS